MPELFPYLNFPGTCREAMTFYQQCLGGKLTIMSHEEASMAEELPPELRQAIMHANLVSGPLTLMASDAMHGPVVNGNAVSLSLNCHSDAEIDGLFAKLADGGQVTMPLADQFWGAKFGMLTDRFGILWMLNFDREPQAQ
jgi:PhnB protein